MKSALLVIKMSQIEQTLEEKAYDKNDGKKYEWVLHINENT